jgi:hypothetical protein
MEVQRWKLDEKNSKSHFGYKFLTIQGVQNDIRANYFVTTESIHDHELDLSISRIANYKDKSHFLVREAVQRQRSTGP